MTEKVDPNDLRSPALAGVCAHFREQPVRTVFVPEWSVEGEPLAIYVTALTLAEQQAIRDAGRAGEADRLVQVLITKAKDAEGKRLFTAADKPTLMRQADAAVLSRVVIEMLSGVRSIEDHEKN